MMAIFTNNPHAFINNNRNYIKAGEIIDIPSKETISQVNKTVAALKVISDEP